MGSLEVRKSEFESRIKSDKIEQIQDLMTKHHITVQDIESHKRVTRRERLNKIREIQGNKARAAENLAKAREARKLNKKGGISHE